MKTINKILAFQICLAAGDTLSYLANKGSIETIVLIHLLVTAAYLLGFWHSGNSNDMKEKTEY